MAIVRVQGNAKGTAGSGTTIAVSMASTPTNGNVLIACIGYYNTSTQGIVSSIAQTGVTWALQKRQQTPSNYQSGTEIWLGVVGAGASKDITITVSQALTMGVADVCEYSGILTTGFLDKTAGVATLGSTTVHSGTTATTTQAVELWIGSLWVPSGTNATLSNPTDGFTMLDGANQVLTYNCALGFMEKIVSATGTAHVDATTSNSNNMGCVATFKASTFVAHSLTVTESLGGLDSISRTKSYFRTITELLGVLDTKTRIKSYYRTITELLGGLDTRTRTKTIYRTVTEPLGLKDSKTRSKTIYRIVTELLGMKDTRSRSRTINRVVTELLGMKDIVTKVAWHWSIPPIPPVITAAVGKIKHVLLDKFLGWLVQPAEDNPRVQCDVEVSWMQTNRVASSIKNFFTETVTIKAKVAHVFTETMPITAAILHEFTESVQIRGTIIQKFEETVHITGDLMKAVIEDGLKVFGEVTPLLEKLRELKRRIDEN